MTMRARIGAVLALLLAMGCTELTEVVLVVESDLDVPADVDGFDLTVISGSIPPTAGPIFNFSTIPDFPLSVGFVSEGTTTNFSFVARLSKFNFSAPEPLLVVSRTVSDVRFVEGEVRMLVLTMPRVCACEGTSCPLPGNPACSNLTSPMLQAFDPDVAPPSTMMTQPGMPVF